MELTIDTEELLSPAEVEAFTAAYGDRHTVGTLAQKRSHGNGPQFIRRGRWILYPKTEVESYLVARRTGLLRSTRECSVPARSTPAAAAATA
jgi:hypothetical protein